MCLAQYIKLGRETKDIDFLLIGLRENIEKMMQEIAAINVGDNFIFSQIEVGEMSIEHKKFPGLRISVQGELGQIKNKVSIDIAMGDVVRASALVIELMKSKEPLFEESLNLNAYPPEYIFSEKIEAILHLGELNSRMKDFYDCYRLIESNALDEMLLKKAVLATLENRETKLEFISQSTVPFRANWQNFLKKSKLDDLDLKMIIAKINNTLKKII